MNSTIGFKEFAFSDLSRIELELRGSGCGLFEVRTQPDGECRGTVEVHDMDSIWQKRSGQVSIPNGVFPLYFTYWGSGSVDMKGFRLIQQKEG